MDCWRRTRASASRCAVLPRINRSNIVAPWSPNGGLAVGFRQPWCLGRQLDFGPGLGQLNQAYSSERPARGSNRFGPGRPGGPIQALRGPGGGAVPGRVGGGGGIYYATGDFGERTERPLWAY